MFLGQMRALNRTILELKQRLYLVLTEDIETLNRTILELKHVTVQLGW